MASKSYSYVLLLVVSLSLTFRCAEEDARGRPKDALVCINRVCLTERDLQHQIPDAYQASITTAEKREYVKRWIRDEILHQEAKSRKLDQDERIRMLVELGTRDILVRELIEQRMQDEVEVTEEEARRYYDQNRQAFAWDDDYLRISHIFTQKTAGATLAGLLLKEGTPFKDAAVKMSEDERTKENGGDLGFVRIRDLFPEIAEHALTLKVGEISPAIPTPYGYEIIRVTDRREKGSPKEFQWAKDEIINTLTLQRRQEEMDQLLGQLKEKMEIQTFDWASDISLEEIR